MNHPMQYVPPALAAVLVLLAAAPVIALVNPNFTVVDLTQSSSEVHALRLAPPRDGRVAGRVVETLRGPTLTGAEAKEIVFIVPDADRIAAQVTEAFDGAGEAAAAMFVAKESEDGKAVGSVQVGTAWFGIVRNADRTWQLGPDPRDLETVWGGSARQVIRAVRYVLNDPSADFPVDSGLSWLDSEELDTLDGPARGCVVTRDGIVVLCDGGDRVYRRPDKEHALPADVTAALGLKTTSRALAAGDFNTDGRVDLASWDGAKLRLVLRKEDGTFGAPSEGTDLARCRSLATVEDRLVVADSDGVTLATPDGKGGFDLRRLSTPDARKELGTGGPAAVADFDDDGRPDVMHVFEEGMVFYAGTGGERRFADPVVRKLTVVTGPTATACGDYDTDGRLDLMVVGRGGANLLARDSGGAWRSRIGDTGELNAAMGPGRGEIGATGVCTTDLNGDGRQTVAVFAAHAAPGLFYARGFACFAIAISLTRSDEPIDGFDALSRGQQAAAMTDLDGDGAPDLFGVDGKGTVWAVLTEPDRLRRFVLTLACPPGKGPMTVDVALGDRLLGTHVLRPGEPTTLSFPRAGKVTLAWKGPDGQPVSREVVVVRPTRIEALTPGSDK